MISEIACVVSGARSASVGKAVHDGGGPERESCMARTTAACSSPGSRGTGAVTWVDDG